MKLTTSTAFLLIIMMLPALTASDSPRTTEIEHYLNEFTSFDPDSKTYQAIYGALEKLSDHDFKMVTNRRRPVLFVNYYTQGIARFASANEFTFHDGDEPAFQEGFYLIKLGDGLENSGDVKAIEGVILHELAHRIFDHIASEKHTCAKEIEANQWVKAQGHTSSFEAASQLFGAKTHGDSVCQDWLKEQQETPK